MLQRIEMVVMYVGDWTAMLEWYQEKLGLTAVYTEEDHRFSVLAFPGGGPVLHLVGDRTRPAESRNRCIPNVGVDEFDKTLAELQQRGVEILEVIDDKEDGYRLARFADPEGNELNAYATVSDPAAESAS